MPTKAAISLPETIGPYRVLGRLGRGGMGQVLRAHDDRLDRPVALKCMLPDVQDRDKALRRFRREARAAARLSHPAIVQVHDWVESDGAHWLVMELVEGRSLREVIGDGALCQERALVIARDIASGLAAAHDAGLVHRDLKAANVMLDAGGRAKILDFGLAKPVRRGGVIEGLTDSQSLTAEGRIVGTVTSMSPEQALGKELDHRCDLFSLGVLLYEMLSGTVPFEGATPVETLTRLCSAREVPLGRLDPSIPDGLSRLVARLLEKDPARRPRDAHAVVREIDRLREPSQQSAAAIPGQTEAGEDDSQEVTRFDDPTREYAEMDQDPGADRPQLTPADTDHAKAEGYIPTPWRRAPWRLLAVIAAAATATALGFWIARSTPPAGLDPAAASETADQGGESEPTPHDHFQAGMALLQRSDREGHIEQAMHRFQQALAEDQDFAPALAGLSWAYRLDHHQGSRDPQRLDQAVAAAEQAVALNEHLALAWSSLGWAHIDQGRLDDAERQLERALEIEPTRAQAWSGLGQIAEERDELERAEQLYRQAVEHRPAEVERLGLLYFRTGRYDEAAEAFEAYLELVPDRFRILSNLGVVYYMQGRLSEAAAQFQQALTIQPDSTLFANMGTIYFTQGLYARSASAFEQAIAGGGSNNALLWGNLGDARRFVPGHEQAARDAYRRAIQLLRRQPQEPPRDATARTRLVLYLAKRGDCDDAAAEIEDLGEPPAEDGHAHFRLTVAHEVCDRRDEALAALAAALRARFSLAEVRRDPELLGLRQDVRYHELVMRFEAGATD